MIDFLPLAHGADIDVYPDVIVLKNGELDAPTADRLLVILAAEQKIKEEKEKALDALKAAMEAAGVIKIDNEDFTITYIAETDREYFDKKAFRERNPDIYDLYVRMQPVKSSVRVKVK